MFGRCETCKQYSHRYCYLTYSVKDKSDGCGSHVARGETANKRLVKLKRSASYVTKYFLPVRDWLDSLRKDYVDNSCVPLPMETFFILPAYFVDKRDREIAAFVCLLTRNKRIEEAIELRNLMTAHPWKWFVSKDYRSVVLTYEGETLPCGIEKNRLCGLLDWLYDVHIGEARQHGVEGNKSYFEDYFYTDPMLYRSLQEVDCLISTASIRFLVMALCDNVLGYGIWTTGRHKKVCPLTVPIKTFLYSIFVLSCYSMPDEAITALGFKNGWEFYLTYQAFKNYYESHMKEVGEMISLYQRIVSKGDAQFMTKLEKMINALKK